MSKKSTSKTNSSFTQQASVTPTNPEWVTNSSQQLQGRINNLLDTDASSLVPGVSQLQQQAFDQTGNLGSYQDPNFTGQVGATRALTSKAPSLLDVNLSDYENPYINDVVNSTLAGFDEQRGMQEANLAAQQARGQKFSGSGSAIERALFNRGSNQDRAGIESGLRSGGFDRATSLAQSDLDRKMQQRQLALSASGLLGDLGNQSAANQRADISLLSDLGGQQREIERQNLGAESNLLTLISALNSQQPYQLFHGQDSTGSGTSNSTTKTKESDPMGAIGGLLGGAGSLLSGLGSMGATLGPLAVLSDERLKTDKRRIGKDAAGRNVYEYRYKGEPEDVRRIGYMAQEVKKTDPQAIRKVSKYMAVDYGLLSDAEAA